MTRVMVSGCFDLLHAGHVAFLEDARALGDELIVCVANSESIRAHKGRKAALPDENRLALVAALRPVDIALLSPVARPLGLDFAPLARELKPDILAVTEDDQYSREKRILCNEIGAEYRVIAKRRVPGTVSTTDIRTRITGTDKVPLRVDFAGGWLDVPRLAQPGGRIVNCAIVPLVHRTFWPYRLGSGLGGSAAHALLQGRDAFRAELANGVGWQDPAIIEESGLCVWESGNSPRLICRVSPDFLLGRMALYWSGKPHDTAALVDKPRPYDAIIEAGQVAQRAVETRSIGLLAEAVEMSYAAQIAEGMEDLPDVPGASRKYCGSGSGGYALYLFRDRNTRKEWLRRTPKAMSIEPYDKWWKKRGPIRDDLYFLQSR